MNLYAVILTGLQLYERVDVRLIREELKARLQLQREWIKIPNNYCIDSRFQSFAWLMTYVQMIHPQKYVCKLSLHQPHPHRSSMVAHSPKISSNPVIIESMSCKTKI